MKTNKPYIIKTAFRFLALTFLLVGPGLVIFASDDQTVLLKEDIKFKRVSDGSVKLTVEDGSGELNDYHFTEFNADVITMLYRRVEMDLIIKNMAKKYFLTKNDARRSVKMTINTLEQWDLVEVESSHGKL